MKYDGFTDGTYSGRALTPAGDRCINLYPESVKSATPENSTVLLGTPGHKLYQQLDPGIYFNQPVSAIYKEPNTGRVFAISNGLLTEFHVDGSITTDSRRSYLGAGVVTFASNAIEMMVTSSLLPNVAQVYRLDTFAITTLIVGTTTGFLGAVSVRMIDNYFMTRLPNSRQFQISAPLDGTTWDAADIGSAERGPDNLVGDMDSHGEYWLFASERIEVFSDTGNPLFPFERINSVAIEQGCAATESVVKLDSQLFWLGQNKDGWARVFTNQGAYTPIGVSDRAVEWWFNQYAMLGGISDAVAFGYQDEDGHSFYVISFPSATCEPNATGGMTEGVVKGATWVYDLAEKKWHERQSFDANHNLGRVLGAYHTFAFGKHLVGGVDSNVYELTTDYFMDNDSVIKRVRRAPHITDEGKMIKFGPLTLSCQVGNGPVGEEDNNVVVLRVSNDGGLTWSNGYRKSLGSVGAYLTRVVWKALGRTRRRVYEVSTTIKAPVCWVNAFFGASEKTNA